MWNNLITEAPDFFTYWNGEFLLLAALTTVALSVLGAVTGSIVGLGIATIRLTKNPALMPVRFVAIVITEFFRRVPFLVTLLLVFYATQMGGAQLPVFVIATASVFLIAAAYMSEIIRSGFLSVHQNQWDAAATLNFTHLQTIRHVILPQAWRIILPPAFSFFVMFIKDTALASQIGVMELTHAGEVLTNRGFSAGLSYGTILVLYFIISYPLSRLGARLEAKYAATRNQ